MVAEAMEVIEKEHVLEINNLMSNGVSLEDSTDFLADDFNDSPFGFNHNQGLGSMGDWF